MSRIHLADSALFGADSGLIIAIKVVGIFAIMVLMTL